MASGKHAVTNLSYIMFMNSYSLLQTVLQQKIKIQQYLSIYIHVKEDVINFPIFSKRLPSSSEKS